MPSLNEIPVGSTIQVFDDASVILGGTPQGYNLIGEAKVLTGGEWFVSGPGLLGFAKLTMTATRSDTGSTSMFGLDIDYNPAVSVTREGMPGTGSVASSQEIPVFPFKAGSVNADSFINEITFASSGSLDDSTITGVKVYRDVDGNGLITSADPLLGESSGFASDNGTSTVVFTEGQLAGNETQDWLTTVVLPMAPSEGQTIQLSIVEKASVDASHVFPIGTAAEVGPAFPVTSDLLTLSASDSLQDWKEANFTEQDLLDDQISGDLADPDMDGIPNFAEYALGLNPKIANSMAYLYPRIEGGKFVWEYTRSTTADQASFQITASTDLTSTMSVTGLFQEVSVTDNEDGTETVRIESVSTVDTNSVLFLILKITGPEPMQQGG